MRAFVANASHELRTPLTSMKLHTEALLEGACEEPEVARRFLHQIDNQIDHLAHTVNDMLDLSQIECCSPERGQQPVQLADLAAEVQAFWEARAIQAGLTLSLATESALPVVWGDPYRLRQLFDNLLDNSIKHTPPGGEVEIRLIRRTPSPSTPGNAVRVEVFDNGRGIPQEHLPRIFDRFYRVEMARDTARDLSPQSGQATQAGAEPDSAMLQPVSGSGLGLAIARSIVLAHGGVIGVNSQPGQGSLFWFELPTP
jgi:signal transduction histidine kinase